MPSKLHIARLSILAVLVFSVPALAPAAETDLSAARAELRALELARAEEQKNYAAAVAAGLAPARIAEYETYLITLGAMIDAQRQRIAAPRNGSDVSLPQADALPVNAPVAAALGSPALTEQEHVEVLDSALGGSLSHFDDMLLREQEQIARRAESIRAAAGGGRVGGAGEGAGSAGEGAGGGAFAGGAGDRGEPSQQGGQGDEALSGPGRSDGPGSESGNEQQTATAGRSGTGSATSAGRPENMPDGQDDDVVARQLREAAEKETDPELRERLWNEYHKYKNASR